MRRLQIARLRQNYYSLVTLKSFFSAGAQVVLFPTRILRLTRRSQQRRRPELTDKQDISRWMTYIQNWLDRFDHPCSRKCQSCFRADTKRFWRVHFGSKTGSDNGRGWVCGVAYR